MNSIKALLRLEFKSRFGSFNLREIKGIIKALIVLAFSALIYLVYIYGVKNFLSSFYIYDMQYLFLVFFISLSEIIMFFMGVSTIVKNLFFSGDNVILLRFPVKSSEVFISKMIFVLIMQSIITIVLDLPVFLLYGNISHQGISFYIIMPVILILCIMLPFLFSNILAIPFMYIKSFLKDKYTLILFIFILGVAGGFAIYMTSVQSVLTFMEEQSMDFFSSRFMVILNGLIQYAVPFRQFANILINHNVLVSILIIAVIFIIISVLAMFIVKKLYLKTMLKNIEIEGSSYVKNTKNRRRSFFGTLIHREFLDIFRSSNYSFQYLAMAFGAPIMVYFCNKLAVFIGETNVGNGVLSALTMLVMLIFVSIIVSFSASSISREGDNFYITKIAPVSYHLQIIVKFTLYMLVAASAIFISFAVLIACKYLTLKLGAIMFSSCLLFATFETCLSIKLDIKKPSFAVGGEGELTAGTPSTFISMFVGLVIAIAVGIFGMVFSFFWVVELTFYIVLGASAFLAILTTFWLFFRLDKSYAKIMQR